MRRSRRLALIELMRKSTTFRLSAEVAAVADRTDMVLNLREPFSMSRLERDYGHNTSLCKHKSQQPGSSGRPNRTAGVPIGRRPHNQPRRKDDGMHSGLLVVESMERESRCATRQILYITRHCGDSRRVQSAQRSILGRGERHILPYL